VVAGQHALYPWRKLVLAIAEPARLPAAWESASSCLSMMFNALLCPYAEVCSHVHAACALGCAGPVLVQAHTHLLARIEYTTPPALMFAVETQASRLLSCWCHLSCHSVFRRDFTLCMKALAGYRTHYDSNSVEANGISVLVRWQPTTPRVPRRLAQRLHGVNRPIR
jgi:hypothetical protein